MSLIVPCPHCGQPIQPAKLLGKVRAATMTREERAKGGYARQYGKRSAATAEPVQK